MSVVDRLTVLEPLQDHLVFLGDFHKFAFARLSIQGLLVDGGQNVRRNLLRYGVLDRGHCGVWRCARACGVTALL